MTVQNILNQTHIWQITTTNITDKIKDTVAKNIIQTENYKCTIRESQFIKIIQIYTPLILEKLHPKKSYICTLISISVQYNLQCTNFEIRVQYNLYWTNFEIKESKKQGVYQITTFTLEHSLDIVILFFRISAISRAFPSAYVDIY